MKQIITKKDIPYLQGRFIVELNIDQDEPDYSAEFRKNPEFWLEKRISFVSHTSAFDIKKISGVKIDKSLVSLSGFYYSHGVFTEDDFVEFFNNYLGDSKYKRYHRLLTTKELDWLNEELKKQKF
jgi:hypothetical protein